MWGWKIFFKFLKCSIQNKIILWNFFWGGGLLNGGLLITLGVRVGGGGQTRFSR